MIYTIRPVELINGQVKVTIDFVDGTTVYDKAFFPQSIDDLKKSIQNELTQETKAKALLVEIQKGIGDLSITPLSQGELDRLTFFEKYTKLKSLEAANSKSFPVDAKTLTDLEAEVKSLYKPEYQIF